MSDLVSASMSAPWASPAAARDAAVAVGLRLVAERAVLSGDDVGRPPPPMPDRRRRPRPREDAGQPG